MHSNSLFITMDQSVINFQARLEFNHVVTTIDAHVRCSSVLALIRANRIVHLAVLAERIVLAVEELDLVFIAINSVADKVAVANISSNVSD